MEPFQVIIYAHRLMTGTFSTMSSSVQYSLFLEVIDVMFIFCSTLWRQIVDENSQTRDPGFSLIGREIPSRIPGIFIGWR